MPAGGFREGWNLVRSEIMRRKNVEGFVESGGVVRLSLRLKRMSAASCLQSSRVFAVRD